MTETSKLLPCPFCGGEAHLSADTSHSTAFFISCETEDCFGLMQWVETQAEAIAAWNARAINPAAIRAAALREAAADLWSQHAEYMACKGRDPGDYTSSFSLAHDAILALIDKEPRNE